MLDFRICLFFQLESYFQFHLYWHNWLPGNALEFGWLIDHIHSHIQQNKHVCISFLFFVFFSFDSQSCVTRKSWSMRSRFSFFFSLSKFTVVITWMQKQHRYENVTTNNFFDFDTFFKTKHNVQCAGAEEKKNQYAFSHHFIWIAFCSFERHRTAFSFVILCNSFQTVRDNRSNYEIIYEIRCVSGGRIPDQFIDEISWVFIIFTIHIISGEFITNTVNYVLILCILFKCCNLGCVCCIMADPI